MHRKRLFFCLFSCERQFFFMKDHVDKLSVLETCALCEVTKVAVVTLLRSPSGLFRRFRAFFRWLLCVLDGDVIVLGYVISEWNDGSYGDMSHGECATFPVVQKWFDWRKGKNLPLQMGHWLPWSPDLLPHTLDLSLARRMCDIVMSQWYCRAPD